MDVTENPIFEQIRRVIRAIPPGEVLGYGEVGHAAGLPRAARTVAWVLKTSPDSARLPWWRVVRQDRRIAIKNPDGAMLQRRLLEAEGWSVRADGLLFRKTDQTTRAVENV